MMFHRFKGTKNKSGGGGGRGSVCVCVSSLIPELPGLSAHRVIHVTPEYPICLQIKSAVTHFILHRVSCKPASLTAEEVHSSTTSRT